MTKVLAKVAVLSSRKILFEQRLFKIYSVDPDEMLHDHGAFHLGFHCLPNIQKIKNVVHAARFYMFFPSSVFFFKINNFIKFFQE